MTVCLREATRADIRAMKRLYVQAFPRAERRPWFLIARARAQGRSDLWTVTADGAFAGLAITLNCGDRVLLDYFAMQPHRRQNGIGAKAMALLRERYADRLFLLEIETTKKPSSEQALRLRRKGFYERCGMVEMPDYSVNLFGVEMEILTAGEVQLPFDRYHEIYEKTFGKRIARHIVLVENAPKDV